MLPKASLLLPEGPDIETGGGRDLLFMSQEVQHGRPARRRWPPDRSSARERARRRALLGDDPRAILAALKAAVLAGASPADLGRSLAYAAALRVARFGTANEHADWEMALHIFTYAIMVPSVLRGWVNGQTSCVLESEIVFGSASHPGPADSP